jgi:hypothetical protein
VYGASGVGAHQHLTMTSPTPGTAGGFLRISELMARWSWWTMGVFRRARQTDPVIGVAFVLAVTR